MVREHPTYLDRIIVDPEILVGKPVIRGTRIPVELVLKRLAQDLDLRTLFEAYPRLTEEDVKACLERRRPSGPFPGHYRAWSAEGRKGD